MKTDILVPVWNLPEVTLQCLDSVWKFTENYQLILVDDCSEQPTAEMLDKLVSAHKGWRLIRNSENLGFQKSMNKAMHQSKAERVCWLNNDTVVTCDWLKHMNDTMTRFKNEKCGFVVPNSTFQFNPPMRMLIGTCPTEDVQLNHILGFCLLIDRHVINEVGYIDEAFSEGYGYDETDLFLRASRQGFTARLSHRAYVYHRAYTSFEAMNPGKLAELYERNKQIFSEKWRASS